VGPLEIQLAGRSGTKMDPPPLKINKFFGFFTLANLARPIFEGNNHKNGQCYFMFYSALKFYDSLKPVYLCSFVAFV
jgi:hypothetical protein